jgi:hypothetical protein
MTSKKSGRLEKKVVPDEGSRDLRRRALAQNIVERKKYARYLFIMLCVWLATMLVVVYTNGLGRIPGTALGFALSDSVIITFITTTTADIAAFFLVVTKYLFAVSDNRV